LRYLFDDYTFDTERRELHRGTDVVSITPQAFDLLDYLIRNRERVVSKDDLISVVFVERRTSPRLPRVSARHAFQSDDELDYACRKPN
jgi:DNA-binding winged helix-turn-helix (wHTH) protein